MRTNISLSCAVLALLIAGCNVGDTGDEQPEPGNTQYEIACEATLTVIGTLEPSGVTPGPEDDCLPDGTWTLQVAVDDMGDCAEVPINATYVYVISRDVDDNAVMDYLGSDGNPEEDRYQPGSAGQTCRANIEHYSADTLKVVYLQPFEDDLVLTGSGTYELWEEIEAAPE